MRSGVGDRDHDVGRGHGVPARRCRPRRSTRLPLQRRPPLPGQPGYLETIDYIDDGRAIHRAERRTFWCRPTGDMCFLGVDRSGRHAGICAGVLLVHEPASPSAGSTRSKTTSATSTRSACGAGIRSPAMRPQDRLSEHARQACRSPTASPPRPIPFWRQRDAIEYLVYLMGGNMRARQARRSRAEASAIGTPA